ncbi:MAG TPA: PAS domain S-box protein [Phototrophicaceae bacterium]|nr:PAS domain S-box protein [Phototrophicaceae bacterium]
MMGTFTGNFARIQTILQRIRHYLAPPIFPHDEDKTRQAQVLHSINITISFIILINSILVVLFAREKFWNIVLIALTLIVIFLSNQVIHRGNIRLASKILVIYAWSTVSLAVAFSGGVTTISGSLYGFVIAMAVMFLGSRAGFITAVVTLVYTLPLMFAQLAGYQLPQVFPLDGMMPWVMLAFSILLLLVLLSRMRSELLNALTIARQQLIEREQMETALRESEERFRLISSVTSDYTFSSRFNTEGTLETIVMGGAFEEITGYRPDEFLAVGWSAILHPDDVEQDRRDMAALNQNQKVVTDVRIIKKDGELRYVRVYANPIWDESRQQLVGINGAVRDITERRIAQKALRESETKFRTIFENAPFAISIADRQGRLVDVNPEFLKLVSLPRDQVLGKNPVEIGLFSDPAIMSNMEKLLLASGETGYIELTYQRPDGQNFILLTSSRVFQLSDAPHALSLMIDITERKYTEDALARERRLVRAVVDHLPDNIYVKDWDGKFLLNNPESLRILGLTHQEEALGKDDFDFFPHDRAAQWLEEHRSIMQSGVPVLDEEFFQPWYEGRRRWIVASTIPLHDERGEVIGLVGINRDISAYKIAEEIARRSEAHLRALLDATNDAAFLLSPDGILLTLNKALAAARNSTIEALIGQNVFDEIIPELRDERLRQFETVLATGEPARWEDGGASGWWNNTMYPVLSLSGEVEAVAVYGRNITGQKRLEAELQDYTARLEQMVEERTVQLRLAKEQIEVILHNTSDAVALAKPNGDIQTTNPAFAAIFGEQVSQTLEQILWTITDQEQIDSVGRALVNVIWDHERQQIEAQVIGEDGTEKDIDLALIPVQSLDETGHQGILVSAHDITHLKEIERFKARFIDDALHDLATPITGLTSRLYLLKLAPEKLDTHVRALENQVEHLRNLLGDLRTLSQLDRKQLDLTLELSNVNQIAMRVFDTYEPVAISRDQSLTIVTDPGLPPVLLDRRQIERVFVNLISNAINYTPNGKRIQVQTTLDENQIVFAVEDEGMGISEEHLPHVFERFYRTSQARQTQSTGTGLGLAIVREIVELHKGSVNVISQPGNGSTFTVRFPIIEDADSDSTYPAGTSNGN